MAESTPLFDMSPEDFGYYLKELESTGRDPEEINFLRREYRKANTAFSGGRQEYEEGLAGEGRKPIWGGIASKPEGATGWDAIKGLEFEPWGGVVTLGNEAVSAVNAPKAAFEGTMPKEDMTLEALGTASMAMTGGLGASGRAAFVNDPSQVNIFGGQKATDPGYTRSGQLASQSIGADKLPRFEIDDSEAVVIPQNIKSFKGKDAEVDTLSTIGDILVHDELFYQYPDIVDIPIGVDTSLTGTKVQGYFRPGDPGTGAKPVIAINESLLSSPDLKKTLVHELQHSVQEKEGFSTGTSTLNPEIEPISKSLRTEYDAKRNEYDKELVGKFNSKETTDKLVDVTQDLLDVMEEEGLDAVRLIEDPKSYSSEFGFTPEGRKKRSLTFLYDRLVSDIEKVQEDYSDTKAFGGKGTGLYKASRNLNNLKSRLEFLAEDLEGMPVSGRLGEFVRKQNAFKKEYNELYDLGLVSPKDYRKAQSELFTDFLGLPKEPELFFDSRYRAYESKMGEVEARNAGDRMDFNMEERFKKNPESTEDTPRSEQWGFPTAYAEGPARSENLDQRPINNHGSKGGLTTEPDIEALPPIPAGSDLKEWPEQQYFAYEPEHFAALNIPEKDLTYIAEAYDQYLYNSSPEAYEALSKNLDRQISTILSEGKSPDDPKYLSSLLSTSDKEKELQLEKSMMQMFGDVLDIGAFEESVLPIVSEAVALINPNGDSVSLDFGEWAWVENKVRQNASKRGIGIGNYAEGGLVAKNAMSDYFMASSGQMSEMEFVGKHKMSTKEFEDRFESENNVDISGAEDIREIVGKPKGNDMNRQMSFFNEGGMTSPRVDPVSGNEVPIGSRPEEVRDDIDAKLSEGEYVVPADVVRFFGVNFFEQLRDKAKSGLQEMAADDRIGGQPAPQQGSGIAPEDMQAITQMAEGGLVDSTNIDSIIDRVVEAAKTNPELQGIFQKRGITMAEGGLVGDLPSANEAAQSTFDPSQWATVGSNMGNTPSGGYGYKQYYSPEGVPMMVLLINGLPAQTIPEGYTTTKPPEVKPVGSAVQRTGQDSPGFSGGADGADGGSLFDPLGKLDFDDPSSVSKEIGKRLSGGADFSGAGSALGGLGGALVGGGISAYGKFRDLAVANAALRVAEDKGDLALAEDLAEQIRAAEQDFGLSGLAKPEWFDGSELYENHMKNKGINPETGEPLKASERAARFTPGARAGEGSRTTPGTGSRSSATSAGSIGSASSSSGEPRSTAGPRSSGTFASQTQAVREAGMSQPSGGMSGRQMTAGSEVGSGPGGSDYAGPMNKGGLVTRRYKK